MSFLEKYSLSLERKSQDLEVIFKQKGPKIELLDLIKESVLFF